MVALPAAVTVTLTSVSTPAPAGSATVDTCEEMIIPRQQIDR